MGGDANDDGPDAEPFLTQPQLANPALSSFSQSLGDGSAYPSEALTGYPHPETVQSTQVPMHPSAYTAWEPLRDSLPPVADHTQSRSSSYYPARRPSQSSLDRALEGLDQDTSLLHSKTSSGRHSLPPASFGGVPLNPPLPENAAALAARSAAFYRQQAEIQAASLGCPPSAYEPARRGSLPESAPIATQFSPLLHSVNQGPSTIPLSAPNVTRQTLYGAYPSQWDFITQPDSYSSEPRPSYTPSYDSLSLAEDNADPLILPVNPVQWRGQSDIGSEDALSSLGNRTPAMSDNGSFDADVASEMPLFGGSSFPNLSLEHRGSRSDTLRMSAERSGHGFDEAHGSLSSLTGEVLAESPPSSTHLAVEHDDLEKPSLSPSMRPFTIPNNSTSPVPRGSSLPKLEIPPTKTESMDSTMMSAESGGETAQPQTARPAGPRAEVEKFLQQLTSQTQITSGVPAFSFIPPTPANGLPHPNPEYNNITSQPTWNRPPNRQRSLSDTQVSPTWSGIDPRMLAGTEFLNESAIAEDDDGLLHESAIGPRRHSAASHHSTPYSIAHQARDQHRAASEEPISPSSSMRRAMSHGFEHRRGAYSEDFGMSYHQHDYLPQYVPEQAMVPSFDGTTGSALGMHAFQGYYAPLPVPSMPTDRSALPRHVRTLSQASSHGSDPSSISDTYSETGGEILEEPVHWDSQTTSATKQAANARRKPGTDAKFVCDYCGETFTRQYNLKGHLRAHNGEKPFACDFPGCHKAFARAHDRQRHMHLHTDVAKYPCKACRRAFKRLDALQRHLRSEQGQHCVEKMMSDGELPPFPNLGRKSTVVL